MPNNNDNTINSFFLIYEFVFRKVWVYSLWVKVLLFNKSMNILLNKKIQFYHKITNKRACLKIEYNN